MSSATPSATDGKAHRVLLRPVGLHIRTSQAWEFPGHTPCGSGAACGRGQKLWPSESCSQQAWTWSPPDPGALVPDKRLPGQPQRPADLMPSPAPSARGHGTDGRRHPARASPHTPQTLLSPAPSASLPPCHPGRGTGGGSRAGGLPVSEELSHSRIGCRPEQLRGWRDGRWTRRRAGARGPQCSSRLQATTPTPAETPRPSGARAYSASCKHVAARCPTRRGRPSYLLPRVWGPWSPHGPSCTQWEVCLLVFSPGTPSRDQRAGAAGAGTGSDTRPG